MSKRSPAYAFFILIQIFSFFSMAGAQTTGAASRKTGAAFHKLVDEYFNFYFRFHPTAATQAGVHQYDNKLEDYSLSAVNAEIAGLNKFKHRIQRNPAAAN